MSPRQAPQHDPRRIKVFSTVLAVVGFLVASPMAHADVVGRAKVLDGNTLTIGRLAVVLYGINAPAADELCSVNNDTVYRCGRVATQALTALVGVAVINCELKTPDRRGFMRAVCYTDQSDLNQAMVRAGHAVALTGETLDYARAEAAAEDTSVGLWRVPGFSPDHIRGRR